MNPELKLLLLESLRLNDAINMLMYSPDFDPKKLASLINEYHIAQAKVHEWVRERVG